MSSKLRWLLIISSAVFFLLAIVAEISGFNKLSCILVTIMLLLILWIVLPKLVIRFKRKNNGFTNFVNLMAIIVFVAICGYVIANLAYYLVFSKKLWDSFEIVLYPAILLYLLIEAYINFVMEEQYKYFDE